MARELILQEVLEQGTREVGRLRGQKIPVGRECPEGISVPSQGVSRTHGLFSQVKNHWLFQDTGSTNGSWLNGAKISPGVMKLVRAGDSIQLGDAVLKLLDVPTPITSTQGGFSISTPQSLLVFQNDTLSDEFPVPEFGRALMIGGAGGDLPLDGDLEEQPSLVFEKRGDAISAFRLAKGAPASINGTPLVEHTTVKDGDQVVIGKYTVMVNDPPRGTRASQSVAQPQSPTIGGNASGEWMDSSSFQKSVVKVSFGQEQEGDPDTGEIDETIAIDTGQVHRGHGYDRHPSMRFDDSYPTSGSWKGPGALEDKLVLLMGGILLLGLVAVVIWWLLH